MKQKSGNNPLGNILANAFGLIFGLAMAASFSSNASACSCLLPESARQAIKTTSHITWVRVVSKSIKGEDRIFQAEAWTAKGAVEISIYSDKESSLCGTDLELGKPILLGMRKYKGQFRTGLCTRFAIDNFHEEIARLINQCKPFEPCPLN